MNLDGARAGRAAIALAPDRRCRRRSPTSRCGCASSRVPRDEIRALAATLSPPERARAARFGRPDLRDRYVVGRATLRIAARDAARRARRRDVEIERGVRGRPYAADAGGPRLQRLAHATAWRSSASPTAGASASTSSTASAQLNVDGVARKFMSPREQAALARARRPMRAGARCCGCGRARKR